MKDGKSSGRGQTLRPVIFGEVLFDIFPDGAAVLGGAPFNVAWHLKGFGLEPLFISRVGNDTNGLLVKQSMLDWGMDVSGIQDDQQYQTGTVSIELTNGQPSFSILPDQAYDHIDKEQALARIHRAMPALFYYGTLISRGDISRATLKALRQFDIPCFVDINLREPWWNMELLDQSIQGAKWLKLNEVELGQFGDRCDYADAAKDLIKKYHFDWIIITKGADGAFITTEDQIIECQPGKVEQIKDTVGAGDAFSAVTIYGILNKWPAHTILQRAVEFAASICMRRGATVNDKTFYKDAMTHWQKD